MKKIFLTLPVLLGALFLNTASHALEVSVSIKPLHSLVSAVMGETGNPNLIVDSASSPHDYQLKPSDAKALEKAEVIFWVGDELETFLDHPLETLGAKARVVSMAEALGLEDEDHDEKDGDHKEEDHHEDDGHHHHGVDMHVWLNPAYAQTMVRTIAKELAQIDSKNAAVYNANATKTLADLSALENRIMSLLSPVQNVPFAVFHDAYGYFEKHFKLNVVAKLTLSPERLPSAKRLYEVRQIINEQNARCVFSEPQFNPKMVDSVINGTRAKTGQLDPLGSTLDNGPDLYIQLMENLAKSLRNCLG